MGDEDPIRTLGDYSKPSHKGYRTTIELPVGNNVVPFLSDTIRLVQNGCSFQGIWSEDPNQHFKDFLKLLAIGLNEELPSSHDTLLLLCRRKEDQQNSFNEYPECPTTSWIILFEAGLVSQRTSSKKSPHHAYDLWLQDLALYDNESWNDPMDFAKSVKAITLPQNVASTSDCRLIELENQVQRLMEAYLAPTQPTQVNKITTPCEICSGPHDTQNCMENPEQAFVEYASSHTNKAGGKWFTFKPEQNNLSWKINPNLREDANGGISNLTRRIKGMHVFLRNFTYVIDFMIVKDISSIIDPRLSQVVLGRPFIEISNMTHDPPEGVVRFINGTDEVAYKIPHKIEQYDSLSDLEKEHTKSVNLRNKEDKRRGVEYVMSKILGFYKEFLEIRPEYLTGMDDEGEVI
ncbi:hypothetical protein Tco_0714068 [Tanacetum coccineum]